MLRLLQIVLLSFVLGILIYPVISEEESIYEILKANGLPVGIFPKGVKEFSFDDKTGRFSVYLNQSCQAKYETELHYDTNITGTIGFGKVGDLSGISAQELFLWFPVKGIRVDVPSSGVIYFDVGVVQKQYALSLFETSRDCVAVGGVIKVQSLMLPLYQVDETLGRDII
ncbi:hypothetical protein AALP_AA3G082500 [Arabis alpina]|uniref:DUF538 domain-containing protein n=1 Tax=Arabis alpina TaxID=50452 RepID=A0A087H7V2_ARAAL|nr:hypothetical protein AALP_AA3G082500 [Arabis alpina]